jgi:flagellar basal body-associated protein FliL
MAKKSTDDAKKKSNKPKIIAAVVVALVGYKFFLAPKPAAKAENAEKKEGAVVALPELTLNLIDDSPTRYLRVGIAVVYWEGKGGGGGGHGGGEAGDDKEAQIASDVAVDILSHKRYADLKTKDGKEHAKTEIVEALNHEGKEGEEPVARILFTSFVMQ